MKSRRWSGRLLTLAVIAFVALGFGLANTRFTAPPRFDGAGYAVLARSLVEGRTYRDWDHPDRPRHTHFPPGYPLVLAGAWSVLGERVQVAHAINLLFEATAVVLAALWFRELFGRRVAFSMALALAVNWSWARTAGAIQSESLFLMLGQAAILLASRRDGADLRMGRSLALGALLGFAVLTRHVGVALVIAIVLDLATSRRWKALGTTLATCSLVITPWIVWLSRARRGSQADLLWSSTSLLESLAGNGLFYVRRIPDQIIGPFIEVATVFSGRPALGWLATGFALVVTVVVVLGWWDCRRDSRGRARRLVPLVALSTMALLLVWPFTEAGRFLIPLVPCLLIGALVGGGAVVGGLIPGRGRGVTVWIARLILAASLPYSVFAIVTDRIGAQQRTQREFDEVCEWIRARVEQPGPVLSRHPGDVYWLTGRSALAPASDDPSEIEELIMRYHVAYLIVDRDRYANAPPHPLGRYVAGGERRVRRAFEAGAVQVFEVVDIANAAGK